LDTNQTNNMLTFATQKPDIRFNAINSGVRNIVSGNEFLASFRVRMDIERNGVMARILPPPTVQYHRASRQVEVARRDAEAGGWNLRDKKVSHSLAIKYWSFINFSPLGPLALQKFVNETIVVCHDTGIRILNLSPIVRNASPEGDVTQIMQRAFLDIGPIPSQREIGIARPIIICILPNDGVPLYKGIKLAGDSLIGIVTQCVQARHASLAKKQYIANVVAKINMKLMGVNQVIAKENVPFIHERPTMIFGADISHPAAGLIHKPSIAAVVGSLDATCARYSPVVSLQKPRVTPEGGYKGPQDVIQDLQAIVSKLARKFYFETGSKPERIIFYRDGVSETQYRRVLDEEVKAIVEACESIESGYRPSITYIAVQKRHQARFRPSAPADMGKDGNVKPGTVVDTQITHPSQFDWFLCSHASLQGTSKPTRYHVLHDEHRFSSDELQALTYNLCYLYGRATRAVSVCPPVYFAHLAARRATLHFEGEGWHEGVLSDAATALAAAAAAGGVDRACDEFIKGYREVNEGLQSTMYYV
ncbi:Piwi domain-containing protein, partial [Blyttiomyces helicus]